jgi:Tripartite tricarboxylate transporter family receptor
MKLGRVFVALAVLLVPVLAAAENWPAQPIRIVVSSGAGGTADILARMMGDRLSPLLGQPVVIEDRPGAGGHLGAGLVARSAPDGYTLLMSGQPTHSVGPHLFKHLTYDPMRDVPPVSMIAVAPNLLVVNASLPVRTLADLVALAREKPGQLTYSSAGNGTSGHLAAELLKTMAHIDIRHVPYKSGPEAVTGVLAGDVSFVFFTSPPSCPRSKPASCGRWQSPALAAACWCRMSRPSRRKGFRALRFWPGTLCLRRAEHPSRLLRGLTRTLRKSCRCRTCGTRWPSLAPSRATWARPSSHALWRSSRPNGVS